MLFAYVQELDPLGNRFASTLIAALPVVTLFYLLVGRRWLASWAGAVGAAVAILLAWLVYRMPLEMAGWSFVNGALFGLLPIGWTVFSAMLLYNVTVETGQFAIIRRSVGSLSGDARVQAVLVGFAFGALMEGAAGAGSPVAICGAMLVGLGFPPFKAAVLCLIANTSPVAYGGLGVPIMTLGSTSTISADTLSVMAGHQLPLLSCLVPLYMVKCMGTWRQTFAVLPVLVVAGGSFALSQYLFATLHYTVPGAPAVWPLTDVGGAIFSLVLTAIFLKFCWKPKHEWHFQTAPKTVREAPAPEPHDSNIEAAKEEVAALLGNEPKGAAEQPLTFWSVAVAWSPFAIMTVCLAVSGFIREAESANKGPLDLGFVQSYYEIEIPTLHRQVLRADRLRKPGATEDESREDAKFKFTWLAAPGSAVALSALISMAWLRTSRRQLVSIFHRTIVQMKVPIPTIALMLGLSYVTKFAGMDATLGIAFAGTGVLYPFFAAMLGWLGVFLTGTDAGSNALFGSLQRITATEVWTNHPAAFENLQLDQAQVLICTANSTGGVMGKMIDAQSICVATAATNQIGREADIFKAVIVHSIVLACVVGALTALQAFVWPFTLMVPHQ